MSRSVVWSDKVHVLSSMPRKQLQLLSQHTLESVTLTIDPTNPLPAVPCREWFLGVLPRRSKQPLVPQNHRDLRVQTPPYQGPTPAYEGPGASGLVILLQFGHFTASAPVPRSSALHLPRSETPQSSAQERHGETPKPSDMSKKACETEKKTRERGISPQRL